jgi:transcriptional regulator
MYIPKHFEERDPGVLHALMRSHPLGAWVMETDGALVVNHVPFIVDSARGEYGTLICHVARTNPIWKSISERVPSVVIFQGPETYITPSWYPTKEAHGKAVPTWNYAVVHAHGFPRATEDREWLLRHVSELSQLHESERPVPWSVSDAPSEYIDNMLKAIVGIEIPISSIDGKWKTSQNRPLPDKLGIITGLNERGDGSSRQMAGLVQRHAAPTQGSQPPSP